MARTITPAQHLSTLRAALAMARAKGMDSEAKQVNALIRDVKRKIEMQEV